MKIEDWPDCITPNCNNKICTWANTELCYLCAVAIHGQYIMDFMYGAYHDENGLIPSAHGIEIDNE